MRKNSVIALVCLLLTSVALGQSGNVGSLHGLKFDANRFILGNLTQSGGILSIVNSWGFPLDSSGNLLIDCAIGCSGGTGTPGGLTTQLQFNNAGAFGGVSQWTTNGTTNLNAGATAILDMHLAAIAGLLLPGSLSSGIVRVTTVTGAMTSAELSGDCTTSGSNAVICTKTNSVAFAPSATTDTTIATNIATGTLNAGRLPATAVQTNQGNTWTTGTQDFSAVTLFKLRVGAALTTTVNGDLGYDTTNKNWHIWGNAVDNINAVIPTSITPANNDCAKWTVVASVITLNTAGAACGTGGSGTVNSGTIGDLAGYTSTGTAVSDSGVVTANVTTAASNYVSGNLVQGAGANKTSSDSGIATANVVTQTSNAASGQICTYTGANKICIPSAALPSGTTATTQAADDNSTKVATTSYVDRLTARGISFTMGDPTGSALTTSQVSYVTVPFACTIAAYNILVDAGTITLKTWKIATGTAIPTVANSISTSGVSISSGTAIHSTTVTDFTTTTVTANDIMAAAITAVTTAKFVNFTLQCNQ